MLKPHGGRHRFIEGRFWRCLLAFSVDAECAVSVFTPIWSEAAPEVFAMLVLCIFLVMIVFRVSLDHEMVGAQTSVSNPPGVTNLLPHSARGLPLGQGAGVRGGASQWSFLRFAPLFLGTLKGRWLRVLFGWCGRCLFFLTLQESKVNTGGGSVASKVHVSLLENVRGIFGFWFMFL